MLSFTPSVWAERTPKLGRNDFEANRSEAL